MTQPEIASGIPAVYAERRARLAQLMQRGVAVVPTAPERSRNRDSHYPYRYDSYFYYLTGFPEPEAVLVLVAGDPVRSILFCRDRDAEREIWDGFRYGLERARIEFHFDESHSISELATLLPKLLADQPALHCHLGSDGRWDERVLQALNAVRAQARTGVTAPAAIHDVRALLDEMRLLKDEHELAIMRRAAQISTDAHRRAMCAVKPGRAEYEIEAELLHEFRRRGAQAPAYTSIVAGGANACVLHYVSNDAVLNAGELLLVDAGCELDGYAADITRTYPVSGRFTPAQRDVYQMVLAAQGAAIAAVRPGAAWTAPHDAALRVLAQGLIDFGLCQGSVDKVIEAGDYKRFYMHRTGHWLGLDVHDAGDYKRDGQWRELKPGMVLTVEPGCYIRGDDVPPQFANTGIRIEDDVLVTASGNEVLTHAAPKSVQDIEALMRG
ncbi:MAG: aminopeptidase P N-terminal domain-containing protein [Betaproteobacteria bacterium]|nr:aminopeptidase P N-terminal domain-containing protein [Betaproteobacteria bacterium]